MGGVDLQQLRASPLYAALRDTLEPLRGASMAIIASDGSRFVVAARGRLEGATMVGPNLAVTGSPDFVAAAIAQHRTGQTGAPELLKHAATDGPLWIVADGAATLPLSGNARNLNRLFHLTRYSSAMATAAARPTVRISGECRNEEDAQRLEESVRALASLARLPAPVEISRAGSSVTFQTQVEPADIQRLFR